MADFSVVIVRLNRFRRKSHPIDCPADILKKVQILTLTDNVTDAFITETIDR